MTQAMPFLPGLSPVAGRSLTAQLDAGNLTSNAGLIVLREAALRLDIARVIAGPLRDTRNPLLITHTYAEMATARMMAIAAGYEDADDLDALRNDPALMIACGRAPETGCDIPSQPTISRLENLADEATLQQIATGFIDLFCSSYTSPPQRIELDIDDTDDMVHGCQQLALFNTHAGGRCFKPIHIFEAASGKPVVSVLRPGKRPSGEEIAEVLEPVIVRIRSRWPKVRILIRGDGHYCAPEVLDLRAASTATISSACRATRRWRPWQSPGASSARTIARRAGPSFAASTNSSMRRAPGRSKKRSSPGSKRRRSAAMPDSSSRTCPDGPSTCTSGSIAHAGKWRT